MVLQIVTSEYLHMQNMNMNAIFVFPKNNSERVISSMSSRRSPVITELSNGAHTTLAPTASPACK